jgi:hypothetical protein
MQVIKFMLSIIRPDFHHQYRTHAQVDNTFLAISKYCAGPEIKSQKPEIQVMVNKPGTVFFFPLY